MKKLSFFVLALLFALGVNAQNYDFPRDAAGNVEVKGSITAVGSAAELTAKVKAWAMANSNAPQTVVEANGAVTFTCTFQTRVQYNPFSGARTDWMSTYFTVVCGDNKVDYTVNNCQLIETYAGWGVNQKSTLLSDKIAEVETARKAITDAEANESLSKKERKEIIKDSEEFIEDTEESLKNAKIEFDKKITEFGKALN